MDAGRVKDWGKKKHTHKTTQNKTNNPPHSICSFDYLFINLFLCLDLNNGAGILRDGGAELYNIIVFICRQFRQSVGCVQRGKHRDSWEPKLPS